MRPAFLHRPESWLRASRDGRSAVDKACALERPAPRRHEAVADVIFATLLGVLGAAALLHWAAA